MTNSMWSHCSALASLLVATVAATYTNGQPPSTATPPTSLPASQVEVLEGIPFAQPGGTALELDLARPRDGEGPFPAVVTLFGGGWISGSRAAVRDRIQYLAGHGYVAVAPNYRLAPQHPFPAAVVDVRECVRWLRRHADEYDVDPDQIGAVGYSAGGHLACMLGLASDVDRFGAEDLAPDGTSARVQAVVNYFGPGDLAAKEWSDLAIRKYLIPFLGGTAEQRPEVYRRASPITYITPDDAPILTFQGDQDRTVPMSLSVALHERLRQVGVPNELVIVEGGAHGWGEPHRTRTRQQMIRFFDQNLKSRRPSTQPARGMSGR